MIGLSSMAHFAPEMAPPQAPTPEFREDAVELPLDDMELLARILCECHLSDGTSASAGPASVQLAVQVAAAQIPNAVSVDAPQNCTAQGAAEWAGEMMRQLQACPSVDLGNRKCAEVMLAFQQQIIGASQQQTHQSCEKMRVLQCANSGLLRGFRNLHNRQKDLAGELRRTREANAAMAAELDRCQDALRASERAKGALQYHLQMVGQPCIAVGGW